MFIQLTQRVSIVQLSIVQYFPAILDKYKESFHSLYQLSALLINKGPHIIMANQQHLITLFQRIMRWPKDTNQSSEV
jgi:hypothetical protein